MNSVRLNCYHHTLFFSKTVVISQKILILAILCYTTDMQKRKILETVINYAATERYRIERSDRSL